MNLPRTGAAEWAGPQASPWNVVNLAMRLLDAGACRFLIEDRDLTAPPGSCADGACYLVAGSPTGAWAGEGGELAVAIGANASNGWQFMTVAVEGAQLYVRDENVTIQHNGSTWVAAGTGTAAGLDYDTDGTLAANSDSKVATQKATKTYVDAKVAGLSWKQAVRVATTASITLATALENGDAIDGVTLATGDRVLVKHQSTASENGIYTVNASGAPTRATDADSGAELVNASVYVSEGTANADTQWTCSTNSPITVGSTSLTFAQLTSGGGALQAANNLSDLASAATARANLGVNQYRVGFFFTTAPSASEVLALHVATDAFTFPANFASPNSRGAVGTNPAASFALDVQKNGSTIGTITISTGGAFTFATSSGTAKSIAAGDVIKVVGPGSADASIANVAITLLGTI